MKHIFTRKHISIKVSKIILCKLILLEYVSVRMWKLGQQKHRKSRFEATEMWMWRNMTSNKFKSGKYRGKCKLGIYNLHNSFITSWYRKGAVDLRRSFWKTVTKWWNVKVTLNRMTGNRWEATRHSLQVCVEVRACMKHFKPLSIK